MTTLEAIEIIEGEEEDFEEEKILVAWQHLIDTNIVWQLQGWYGRTAAALIRDGICKPKEQQQTTNPEYCDACECTPCDCGWGNY